MTNLNPNTSRGLKILSYLFLCILLSTSCQDDDMMGDGSMGGGGGGMDTTMTNPPVMPCDETLRPIVMMHGFLASGDTYASQVLRFASNEYCEDRLFLFDWNSLGQTSAVTNLDVFINNVLDETGAAAIDLVGHSAGGGLGYDYLSDADRAAKVAHYAHLASNPNSQPAGANAEVPTINIWSDEDLTVAGADIAGATNVMLTGKDHYQVATDVTTFEELFKFFNDGTAPETTQILEEETITLNGKALLLGENTPMIGASVSIYTLDAATGFRQNDEPDATFIADENGHWGPFEAAGDMHYEFFLESATAGERPIHYYRETFTRSNPVVYLRGFPAPGSLAGILLGGIPKDDMQTALSIFASSQAVIADRDILKANDFELSTSQYAPPSKTAIAFFLYDDGDYSTSGDIHTTFATFNVPFLTGMDVYLPTEVRETIALTFNGRSLNIPNLKSETDGVIVAVFD